MRIYGYLRASTLDQDASRAKKTLSKFIEDKGQKVSAWFIENASGSQLNRPELLRLLEIAESGDVLLTEQIDRISRLNTKDWNALKNIISRKNIKVVSYDLPTSHQFIQSSDEFTQRMLNAINDMMLDMLAAIARKDFDDRRRRQAEGVSKAKSLGKYKGRPINKVLHERIENMLRDGKSYNYIQDILGCSRHTISRVSKQCRTD